MLLLAWLQVSAEQERLPGTVVAEAWDSAALWGVPAPAGPPALGLVRLTCGLWVELPCARCGVTRHGTTQLHRTPHHQLLLHGKIGATAVVLKQDEKSSGRRCSLWAAVCDV